MARRSQWRITVTTRVTLVVVQCAFLGILAAACGGASSEPTAIVPQCDPSLWSHVHDPSRLKILNSCVTVTGTVMAESPDNDDGDMTMQVALDPAYTQLLNSDNISKLSGWLQVEAVCQAPYNGHIPDTARACQNFTGTVFIPPIGMHVQITGTYVNDTNHGWTEIHPVTTITPIR